MPSWWTDWTKTACFTSTGERTGTSMVSSASTSFMPTNRHTTRRQRVPRLVSSPTIRPYSYIPTASTSVCPTPCSERDLNWPSIRLPSSLSQSTARRHQYVCGCATRPPTPSPRPWSFSRTTLPTSIPLKTAAIAPSPASHSNLASNASYR